MPAKKEQASKNRNWLARTRTWTKKQEHVSINRIKWIVRSRNRLRKHELHDHDH
jgi:hypothetical protein